MKKKLAIGKTDICTIGQSLLKTQLFLFSVLSRIKVSLEDVLIRFEHLFSNKKSGVGLELHIERFVVNS